MSGTKAKLKNQSLIEIEQGIHFGAKTGVIIETTKYQTEPDTMPNLLGNQAGWPWAIWGLDNNYPQKVIDENGEETTSAGCIRFKRDAHYGKGPMLYREEQDADGNIKIKPLLKTEIPKEIADFWFNNDIDNFIQGIITDFEWWNMYYTQYIPNFERNKIVGVKYQRVRDIRSRKRNPETGKIDSYFLSAQWPQPLSAKYVEIPAFDKANPFSQPNAIYRHALVSVDKDYYMKPEWHSNLRWLNIAKKIPIWIDSNIDNSVNIKYHVKLPQEYFEKLYPRDRYDSDQAWMKAMSEAEVALKQKIDEMLSGAENVSKIFYSKVALDDDGKPYPGWEIIELQNDIKDAAWLNAYNTAAAAECTAHGVPPSLAGVIMPNGLGAGSGSDTREQFNFYVQLRTVQPRQTTTEWFEFVKRFNKWPEDIHLGYREIVFQSMDQNKSGFQVQKESSPTSPNKAP